MVDVALSVLSPGESGTIVRIATAQAGTRKRLLELGLTRGTNIEVVRFAPLGDPIEVKVGTSRLTLRKSEAQSVFIHRQAT